MPIAKGKDILLELQSASGVFEVVGGIRAQTISLSTSLADVTHVQSEGWRELLPGGGVRQISVSGSGIFLNDAASARAQSLFFAHQVGQWRLTIPGRGTFEGPFHLTNFDFAGEYRGEVTYALSLASGGAVTFTPEAS